MKGWKLIFLFNWMIFRFHVSFRGSSWFPWRRGSERFGASHCRVSHEKHESELKNAQKYRPYEGMINQHYPPDKALLRPDKALLGRGYC